MYTKRAGLQVRLLVSAALAVAMCVAFIPNLSSVSARSAGPLAANRYLALYQDLRPMAASKSTLVVDSPSDMQNLDPTLSSGDIPTQETLTNIYSWLLDYAQGTKKGQKIGEPNKFVGAIASKIEIKHHYRGFPEVVRFLIRHNLKFANGDPLNAAAVKWTYDRVYAQNGVTPFLLSTLSGVSDAKHIVEVNKYEVDFEMSVANKLLFGNMAQFGHSILDPKVVSPHESSSDPYAHNWLASNAAGTESGPYILANWTHGVGWTLKASPHFYGPKPKIKTVIFRVVPSAEARLTDLENGDADVSYGIATKDVAGLRKNKNVRVQVFPSRFVVFLGMNSALPPFNKVKVREAIDYAVPYSTILKNVYHKLAVPLTSPIPFGTPTHTAKFDHYKTNYAKAKSLLKAAHMAGGFTTTLDVANDSQEGLETAVYVKAALAHIGVTVNIDQMPGATFTSDLQKKQLGFFFFNNWISINNDPFYHIYWLFQSSCCDYTNYKNKTVNSLINTWTLSNKTKPRNAAAVKAQKIIMSQAPWAFLVQPDYIMATRKIVHGYEFYSSDQFTRYRLLSKS